MCVMLEIDSKILDFLVLGGFNLISSFLDIVVIGNFEILVLHDVMGIGSVQRGNANRFYFSSLVIVG